MKIKYVVTLLVIFISMNTRTQAQYVHTDALQLDDLILGGKNHAKFTPKNLKQLQWAGNHYIYLKGDSIIAAKPNVEDKEFVALTLDQLNGVLEAEGLPTTSSLPAFTLPDPKKMIVDFSYKSGIVKYDLSKHKIIAHYKLEKKWKNIEHSPSNNFIAFTDSNNVAILEPNGDMYSVTAESDPNIVCGTTVHQNEFGIKKGLFWSPDGNALAFYRMDQRMVNDYPIVNISHRTAKVEAIKYPMAGLKSHEVTIGIYHINAKKTVFLWTGTPKDKYLTNIAWSPDEKFIYVEELNRDQNHCQLVRYNAVTGEQDAILLHEYDDKYVEPQHPIVFLPNNPNRFIRQSQQDGFNHLYLYDTTGKLIRQLTKGHWVVTELLGFDAHTSNLYFTATLNPNHIEDPLRRFAWQLNIRSGVMTCMTNKIAFHQVKLSPNGNFIIDYYSAPNIPRNIEVVSTKDITSTKTLLVADNPFHDHQLPNISVGTILADDDSTVLHYRLTTPHDLEVGRKYPAVVYVYGGPHAQMVNGGWMCGIGGWDVYMALNGYVVYTVDGRGSAYRGMRFESEIHRQLGTIEMKDQIKGVQFLKSLEFVDQEKIGVFGWSYGGFMAINLILTYPDIFKVAVAGGPVINWKYYEIMYGERYMDHPEQNPEGYENNNLINKADQLKGRLLVIHGDQDPVVVWQHSLAFIKACVDKGTLPDYFVYPGHRHNVTGKDRVHLFKKITTYFRDFLR